MEHSRDKHHPKSHTHTHTVKLDNQTVVRFYALECDVDMVNGLGLHQLCEAGNVVAIKC